MVDLFRLGEPLGLFAQRLLQLLGVEVLAVAFELARRPLRRGCCRFLLLLKPLRLES